jgi:hypothetical protein
MARFRLSILNQGHSRKNDNAQWKSYRGYNDAPPQRSRDLKKRGLDIAWRWELDELSPFSLL